MQAEMDPVESHTCWPIRHRPLDEVFTYQKSSSRSLYPERIRATSIAPSATR